MATKRPVLCPLCGAQVRKSGYCSACYMQYDVAKKAINTSNYYYNIGYDKATVRDLSGAVNALLTSLRYNKKNINSRNLLGLIYYEMGEIVNALSQWVMSINFQSSDNIANRYLKELKSDPTRLDAINQIAKKYNMALGYAHSGDYDLAILQLKSVLSDNPHFVKGYIFLALIYMEIENYEKARKALKRALKIDKTNPLAIRYLHEMGDSDENIVQMQMDEANDDFLEEELEPAVNININGRTEKRQKEGVFREFQVKKKDNTVKMGEYGEVSFARYSGMYMILGVIVGVLLFSFIILPHQKKKYKAENKDLLSVYSEEIAEKDADISELNSNIALLEQQIAAKEKAESIANNPLPDYSEVQNGMSEEDLDSMITNE